MLTPSLGTAMVVFGGISTGYAAATGRFPLWARVGTGLLAGAVAIVVIGKSRNGTPGGDQKTDLIGGETLDGFDGLI